MSVADKLLQINQVKQDIKTAIENKGGDLTSVDFSGYAGKIDEIQTGGGVVDEYYYYDYAKLYYTLTNNSTLFENTWQDMKDSETILFDIPLELAVPNQEIGGIPISPSFDLYVGTNEQLQALYDACVNETITPSEMTPFGAQDSTPYYVNNVATLCMGNMGVMFGFPTPLYAFGNDYDTMFMIVDLTPLEMGLGLVLAKIPNVPIPNNNIVIQQGFEFDKESGTIIPNSVTSIGDMAFSNWSSNNQPLIIPNSVTSIGRYAFNNWSSNNQLLVIPNSVTSIGDYTFEYWEANTHPLVIPDSVTSIGDCAFYRWLLVPYVEIQAITPPTLVNIDAFGKQDNAPIYVPDASVTAYKTATNWVNLASRIFSINDK